MHLRNQLTCRPLLALMLVCAAGPVLAEKTTYQARKSANFPKAAQFSRIAVLPFRGQDGAAFTSVLVGSLQSASFDGKSVFDVRTMESQNYTPPRKGAIETAETAAAIRTGQKLGVDVVYVGEVVGAALARTNYKESRQECAQSQGLLGCKQMRNVSVPCVKTTVNYSVLPRAIRVSTGQIVYSNKASFQDFYDQCNGEVKSKNTLGESFDKIKIIFGGNRKAADADDRGPQQITTDEGLLDAVRAHVAEMIRQDVAPYNIPIAIDFKDDAPELGKADRAKFRMAYGLAKGRVVDRACGEWQSLGSAPSVTSISLLYNLGACQEILEPDDPAAALEIYEKAINLMTKPYAPLVDARERMRRMVDRKKAIRTN